ncbi:hypothetical protein M9H77_17174 [Catharanthus roseus]|uniref:Uncharacterized protein n=1 Tax=Catharanthus roseus TaxID=4058 RepID=A0ACC0B3T6_CATRO|nr:hypothetical protein M9H77_17174 [Catharanthus roseus]
MSHPLATRKDKSIYKVFVVDIFKQENGHLEGSFNNKTSCYLEDFFKEAIAKSPGEDSRGLGCLPARPARHLGSDINLSYWVDCNCENRRRMGLQPIKTWSLMKQVLRSRCGVENREGQRQGQARVKFMESSMRIQSQFFNFLIETCGAKPDHGMKAKEEGMGQELSIGCEDKPISLSLKPFLLCHEFFFKESKLFLELYASYVILGGKCMVKPFTWEQGLDVAHKFKSSSSYAYVEKQLLDSVARIKLSYHVLELLHDNLFFDHIVASFLSSCASMWSKIHIFLRSLVKSVYVKKISWFSWSLCDVFDAKLKGEFVENCDYVSYFLYSSMKIFYGFIPSIQLLCFVSHKFEFPYEEQEVLNFDKFFKVLLKHSWVSIISFSS